MLATASRRAYPRYGIATVIVLALFVAVPAILIGLDPGGGPGMTAAGEVIQAPVNLQFTAPAGWEQTDAAGTIILKKGNAAIQLALEEWTGTPAELYEETRKNIEQGAKVISMEDPSPTTVNGIPAVEGTAHLTVNGADTTAIIVTAADGTNGIVAEIDGPLLDVNNLKGEFEQVLSTLTIPDLGAGA